MGSLAASSASSSSPQRGGLPQKPGLGPSRQTQGKSQQGMRSFNTTGPVFPDRHYSSPPLERIDLDRILNLIHQEKYFSLHAPRQTGKTSILLALQNLLNSGSKGPYRCVYVNVEAGQTAREDVGRAMRTILGRLGSRASLALGDDFVANNRRQILEQFGPDEVLQEALTQWARANQNPLVLLIDEIDALIGDTLLATLRQLRSGYDLRPNSFPHSIILCGVRDLRDYRIFSSSEGQSIAGGARSTLAPALFDWETSRVQKLKPC